MTRVRGVVVREHKRHHYQRRREQVKVYVEFASAEDTRAVLHRCMGHAFGFRILGERRHWRHVDGKVPVMLWDYAAENRVRRESAVATETEGHQDEDEGERKAVFNWIYVHRWRGTRERLESEFGGLMGFERVLLGALRRFSLLFLP